MGLPKNCVYMIWKIGENKGKNKKIRRNLKERKKNNRRSAEINKNVSVTINVAGLRLRV